MPDETWNVQSVLTHLTLAIESLREETKQQFIEADRRYNERDLADKEAVKAALMASKEAVQAALVAAEKAVNAAFAASEKANAKNEEALSEFKENNNKHKETLLGLLDKMPTKSDLQAVKDQLGQANALISELRESRATGAGRQSANERSGDRSHDNVKWLIGLMVTIAIALLVQFLISQRGP